jgi:hypothetical protein
MLLIENNYKDKIERFNTTTNILDFVCPNIEKTIMQLSQFSRKSCIIFPEKISKIINIEQIKEKNRLLFLYDIKEKIKDELGDSKKIYDFVEEIFTKEIKNAEYNNKHFLFFWNKKKVLKDEINPILNKHFQFIFEDM